MDGLHLLVKPSGTTRVCTESLSVILYLAKWRGRKRVREGLFWLSDRQWARIGPHLPSGLPGPARDDDRRIISGIIYMLQSGARWRDCPPEYGP